jgi:hypothetical protein
MKRRTFVKKSVAASILTPLALTGLINAAGAEGGETNILWTGTTFTGTDDWTWFLYETMSSDYTTHVDPYPLFPSFDCDEAIKPGHRVRWVYVEGSCYKLVELKAANSWCVVKRVVCSSDQTPLDDNPFGLTCEQVKNASKNKDGVFRYRLGYIKGQKCHSAGVLN